MKSHQNFFSSPDGWTDDGEVIPLYCRCFVACDTKMRHLDHLQLFFLRWLGLSFLITYVQLIENNITRHILTNLKCDNSSVKLVCKVSKRNSYEIDEHCIH